MLRIDTPIRACAPDSGDVLVFIWLQYAMIIYSVTITLQREIETEWLDWMKRIHVPDVLRTGCFLSCYAYKVVGGEDSEPTYVLQYYCESLDDYERYRDGFVPALQKEHSEKFAGRFRPSRQILEQIFVLGRSST
jgi:hypothetical protein